MNNQRPVNDYSLIDGDDRLADLQAYQRVAVMHALATHEIVGAIKHGANEVDLIAHVRKLPVPSLKRLLRAAEDMGLIPSHESGTCWVTARGERLVPDHPNSLYSTIKLSVEQYWPAWRELNRAIRTGVTTFADVHGRPPWVWRRLHPEHGDYFNQWQAQQSRLVLKEIIDPIDLQSVLTVVDIGGGQGAFLKACHARWPHLQLVLFEKEETIKAIPDPCRGDPLIDGVSGDFFNQIDVRGDLFLLKSILHDWDDKQRSFFCANARRSCETIHDYSSLSVF